MKLKAIQNLFHEELKLIFPSQEIDSFFYMLIDRYYGVSRIQLATSRDKSVPDASKIIESLGLLKKEKPIQYILGDTIFFGLPLKVNENVLIPRPETEELVEWVLKYARTTNEIKILDVGTGSGSIAVSLASHLPDATIYGLDISSKALKVAKDNAQINKVNVNFIEADILSLDCIKDVEFDIIVSNPPYVREKEKKQMKANVLNNEPHLALFVKDNDALKFYKGIIKFSRISLKSGGMLFFEINEYLGKDMIALFQAHEFSKVVLKQDMFKKDRMIKGIKG
ncbi:peptide chain release factor N(5)-glutamine methyltransferase [Cognatitamlana onchidii]|uniref:peptide chain release factor N(5)-glutamine methyltransferase n=1 Tax=Cognatitamlana onchidii TaxID=2562860 RepID=UPI0010A612F1|nr:peptide chain release factor N(5)-glutamine methyltransferase [Algibacter onchidii]